MAVTLFRVIQLIFENNFNFYIFLARIKMRKSRMDIFVYHFTRDIQRAVASNLGTQIYCRNYARKNYRPREYPIEHD